MGHWTVIPPRSREWLLENFVIGTKNYWFTFIADTGTALFLLGMDFRQGPGAIWSMPLAFLAGIGAWTFSEYAFHRWIYHHAGSIFGDGHRIHHETPESLIAMPWFMTTLAMVAVWWLGARVLGIPYFASVQAGWLIGFVWYSIVHHVHHHSRLSSPWLRRLKAYHKVHHQFPDRNYGVTMIFWDRAFGTRHISSAAKKTAHSATPLATHSATLSPRPVSTRFQEVGPAE